MKTNNNEIFQRSTLLLGANAMQRIYDARVIIFGIGGVGSWCAESLVRSGIKHLSIVDADTICVTNCNRQLMATSKTIGRVKVDALRDRLLEINPNAEIEAIEKCYDETTANEFQLAKYDYVIDAIDSLKYKAMLILNATRIKSLTLFSSMGAALRTDPFKIRQAEFWDVRGDSLARALRDKFKHNGTFPSRKFRCVYSEEAPKSNRGLMLHSENETSQSFTKVKTNGSLNHITAMFGFALAGMVINSITEKDESRPTPYFFYI